LPLAAIQSSERGVSKEDVVVVLVVVKIFFSHYNSLEHGLNEIFSAGSFERARRGRDRRCKNLMQPLQQP
jgi:hypothetical protein